MAYRIDYGIGVLRSIERFPKTIQRRIVTRIGMLSSNPRPAGSIKLKGEEAYRIRVGDYRIIYTIHDERLVVLIIDIATAVMSIAVAKS
jgi:mRNA interferase RelE/StbE